MASEEKRRKREGSFPHGANKIDGREGKRKKKKKGAGKEKQGENM